MAGLVSQHGTGVWRSQLLRQAGRHGPENLDATLIRHYQHIVKDRGLIVVAAQAAVARGNRSFLGPEQGAGVSVENVQVNSRILVPTCNVCFCPNV